MTCFNPLNAPRARRLNGIAHIVRQNVLRSIAAAALGLFLGAGSMAAQSQCGDWCVSCGENGWGREGTILSSGGGYHHRCVKGNKCSEVGCSDLNAPGPSEPSEAQALEVLESGNPDEMRRVAEHYGSRLLLHEPRRLLAIRGADCASDHVVAVKYLTPAATRTLSSVGLTDLESFLDRSATLADDVGR